MVGFFSLIIRKSKLKEENEDENLEDDEYAMGINDNDVRNNDSVVFYQHF